VTHSEPIRMAAYSSNIMYVLFVSIVAGDISGFCSVFVVVQVSGFE